MNTIPIHHFDSLPSTKRYVNDKATRAVGINPGRTAFGHRWKHPVSRQRKGMRRRGIV
jgi:hypothetical protein